MAYLLNFVYLAAIVLALPLLIYRRVRHGKYREGWDEKFWGRVPERKSDKPCIWLHAVSVGEVNLLEPILKRWASLHPDWDCVISTTTQTGYHLALKRYRPWSVIYCPLDFTWAVGAAMRRIQPTVLVLTELELWPNLIAAARQHGAKVAVINGRLSEKSLAGYRWIARLVRSVLAQVDLLAIQNKDYAERFSRLGGRVNALHVTGSIKFDGARTSRDGEQTRRLAQLARIGADDIVFLAGSTQDPEESLALTVFERLAEQFPRLRLILVPRHPERFNEVAELLDRRGVTWQRRSRLEADSAQPPARILLVDAVGELGYWWGTAKIAFVGGSLTQRGGQNMIEPAGYGAAVLFGPNTWNFKDVVELLLGQNAATVVCSGDDLTAQLDKLLSDRTRAAELGERARRLVTAQRGATARMVELLDRVLPDARDWPTALDVRAA